MSTVKYITSGEFTDGVTTDTISEYTSGAGVTIDGVLLKDSTVTSSALTDTRVVFAGAGGILTDDADMTFATDTLTVTKIAATTFTGNSLYNTTTQLQFRDSAIYIDSSQDGRLRLKADVDIDVDTPKMFLRTNTVLEFRDSAIFINSIADTFLDLTADGAVRVTGGIAYTPDAITATDAGVAASTTTGLTEITTNGDTDEDEVTLANGLTDGQVKRFAVVAVGNAGDSVKITPTSMTGGTQITFAANPLGLGCIMSYDVTTTSWTVIGNNGGTIT